MAFYPGGSQSPKQQLMSATMATKGLSGGTSSSQQQMMNVNQ